MNSFYSQEELHHLGLEHVGENVLISKKCSIYSPQIISIGDHVRIDDFCILSGKITLKNYIHIAAYCGLFGGEEGITIEDYSTMSSKGTIYALSDDYSGTTMTNPMVNNLYKNVIEKKVVIERHVIIGTNSTILPGVTIEEGCAIGACSLIKEDCAAWGIYAGIPAKRIKSRSQNLLALERTMQMQVKDPDSNDKPIEGFEKPIYVTRSFLPPIKEFEEKIESIWENHWLTNNGPLHKQLEEELKQYLKVSNTVLFVNGHLALDSAIKVLGIKGEVITTPFTFASTTHAIVMNHLVPIFCDINKSDFTIDVTQIERLVTERTTAIIPVHVFGHPCDVKAIEKIASKYNLKVIYDAAHVFGVEADGQGIGSFGDIAMFSLHATKVYHAIEGGILTFKDEKLKEQLRLYKNFGITGTEGVKAIGINAKMNEFQAAMGLINLKHIDEQIKQRKRIYEVYRTELNKIQGIYFVQDESGIKQNYSYFPIVIDEAKVHITRNELYNKLQHYNVFTRKYFHPIVTEFECYRNVYESIHLNNAKYIGDNILTLPIYGDLTQEDAFKIMKIIAYIINESALKGE